MMPRKGCSLTWFGVVMAEARSTWITDSTSSLNATANKAFAADCMASVNLWSPSTCCFSRGYSPVMLAYHPKESWLLQYNPVSNIQCATAALLIS